MHLDLIYAQYYAFEYDTAYLSHFRKNMNFPSEVPMSQVHFDLKYF
jgi:hypothetical protein